MFRKIKVYFREKKEFRKLMLDTAKKMNNAVTTISLITDTFAAEGMFDNLSQFIDDVHSLVSDPNLTTEYFKKVNENSHQERMAAMEEEK